jgi:transposase-like protein
MIVLEGLKGKPVAALYAEHQISQAQYDPWRDQFLVHAAKAFEVHEQSQREARPARENARLKTRVGELTLELKKRPSAGMSRQRSSLVAQRHASLLQQVQALKAEPPFWGYRRLWAYLPLQNSCR